MFEAASLSGFVLVGGKSRRMGRDKALLAFQGKTLAEYAASQLQQVAHTVCLVGNPSLYGELGFAVIPDAAPDRGPLSGIEAALNSPFAGEWNIIIACDLPGISAALLGSLAEETAKQESEIDCVVPRRNSGQMEPLCAAYRHRCGVAAQQELAVGTRRVVDLIGMLQASFWPVDDAALFRNINTARDWDQFLNDR